MRQRLPALCLFLLAPLIGELLLGNLPLASGSTLAALPVLALLYGAGAIVIREVTVRAGRGWPTMAVLAVAYGLIEEGLVTQSLFNPSFTGLPLNEYGQIAGIGVPWAVFVLTIHSVWSILVPCVLVEALFPARAGKPWLKVPGLVVATVLYVVGGTAMAFGTMYSEDFVAQPVQLGVTAALAAVPAAGAFVVRTAGERTDVQRHKPWPPTVIGICAFTAGSLFFALYHLGVSLRLLPAAADIAGLVVLVGAFTAAIAANAVRGGWSHRHRLALAAGGIGTYCWAGILVQNSQYGFHPGATLIQALLVLGAAALTIIAHRRLRGATTGKARP